MTIEAKNLLKIYGKRRVVNDVSFNVERGEVVGLLGPNGAGKTTSFYMVVGLVKPNKGRIYLDGKDISKMPMYKRARHGLGYLPQEPSVFRKLSVEENILAIWQLRGGAPKLNLFEKITLTLRKRERSWWLRERFEQLYQNFINDSRADISPELKPVLTEGFEAESKNEKILSLHTNHIFYLYEFITKLGLDYNAHKEQILNFVLEYSRIYKNGRKKKLEGFLTELWKIKRDHFFHTYLESGSAQERKSILAEVLRIMDIENESTLKEIENTPELITQNNLIDYISELEQLYWSGRKNLLSENTEEVKRIEELGRDKKEKELITLLTSINFKEAEIKEVTESLSWSRKQSQQVQLDDILDEFNITHIRNSRGSDLSGGERRRVEIARAVANKPSFLLLDEPFAGIDPIAVAGIKEMIVLLKNRNIGVLITDHNVRETLKIIDRGYILSDGRVIEQGTREHLANSDVARKHYLGEDFSL